MIDSVLIPEIRVKVLKDKKTKNELESALNVKINFSGNDVEIDGEGLELFTAKNIVKAIGRGFSPHNSMRLLDEEQQLEIIELNNYNEKALKRIKSRVIGSNGKTRKQIELHSGAVVSVFGKTISIIGTYKQLNIARDAVLMIVRGSKHSAVYSFLHRKSVKTI